MPEQHADVVVIGAGPAGIAAACEAARDHRVLLLDSAPRPGGQVWRHRSRDTLGFTAQRWLRRLDQCGAEFLGGVTVTDMGRGRVACVARGGPAVYRAEAIVLATGARERYLPFPGWTLPGVMGIGGVQALIKSGARMPQLRIVLAGSGPLLYPVAAACAEAGAELVCVAEQASVWQLTRFATGLWCHPAKLLDALRYRVRAGGADFCTSSWVQSVERQGQGLVAELVTPAGVQRLKCDVLGTGFGLVPSTELAELAGCSVADGRIVVSERQETTVSGILAAGEGTGIGGADAALVEGRIAGAMAAGRGVTAELPLRAQRQHRRFSAALQRHFMLRPEIRQLADAQTIVCRCEDVRLEALDPQWGTRHAKLMTRAGMGLCQGRVCGPVLETLFGWTSDSRRMPAFPAPVGALISHCTNVETMDTFTEQ